MMRDECIRAVTAAIGREITKAEAATIEQRVIAGMRQANRMDNAAFRLMSPAQRVEAGGAIAAKELVEAARLEKRRTILTIQKFDAASRSIADMKARGIAGVDAVRRLLVTDADGKSNVQSVETTSTAIKTDVLRQLYDTFTAVHPKFFSLFEDQAGVRAFTRAIFGEKSGNAQLDQAAKQWHDVTDALRQRWNDAGGKTGFLTDWNIPQHHSMVRIMAATEEAYTTFVLPLLNRARYLNDDGTPMDDTQVEAFIKEAYHTLSTGGANSRRLVDAANTSAIANRQAQHREIHFKDADSYLEYQDKFGERTLWNVMTGHVDNMSKQLGALEVLGPNPRNTVAALLDRETLQLSHDPVAQVKAATEADQVLSLFDYQTGNVLPVANRRIAQAFDTLRNFLNLRLGSAVITSLTDYAVLGITAKMNGLPPIRAFRDQLTTLNPFNRTERAIALRAGLAVDAMTAHLNRWGTDNLGPTTSSKMASTFMRLSGMEALDNARRRGFGVTMMHAIGSAVEKFDALDKVGKDDGPMLRQKGLTDADWQVWRAAKLEDWGKGNGALTPDAIMGIDGAELDRLAQPIRAGLAAERDAKVAAIQANSALTPAARAESIKEWSRVYDEQIANAATKMQRDAVTKLLGLVTEEMNMAIVRPGDADRYRSGGQFQRGTWRGEIGRSFFVFKGFPLAMISKHWRRALAQPTPAGKAAYLATFIAGTTVLGVVAQTINELLAGKDVRNYNPAEKYGVRNWTAAFLKGGSLGMYGDFLFAGGAGDGRQSLAATLGGPALGLLEEATNLTQGNAVQAAQGKDTHFGAEATRFVKGFVPGSSLWYTKSAMDHLIFHNLQEYFSPGYLNKMRRRTEHEFGQKYWWTPGTGVKGMRAPDLSHLFGDN